MNFNRVPLNLQFVYNWGNRRARARKMPAGERFRARYAAAPVRPYHRCLTCSAVSPAGILPTAHACTHACACVRAHAHVRARTRACAPASAPAPAPAPPPLHPRPAPAPTPAPAPARARAPTSAPARASAPVPHARARLRPRASAPAPRAYGPRAPVCGPLHVCPVPKIRTVSRLKNADKLLLGKYHIFNMFSRKNNIL